MLCFPKEERTNDTPRPLVIKPHLSFLSFSVHSRICQQVMARKWFQLVGEDGNALAPVDAVVVDFEDVAALRHAVKLKYADSDLAGIAPYKLTVFANRAAFDTNQALPRLFSSVKEYGNDEDNVIIVQVPPKAASDTALGKRCLSVCGIECLLCDISHRLGHFSTLTYPSGKEECVGDASASHISIHTRVSDCRSRGGGLVAKWVETHGEMLEYWLTNRGQTPVDVEAPPIRQEAGPSTTCSVAEQAPLIQHPTMAMTSNRNKKPTNKTKKNTNIEPE